MGLAGDRSATAPLEKVPPAAGGEPEPGDARTPPYFISTNFTPIRFVFTDEPVSCVAACPLRGPGSLSKRSGARRSRPRGRPTTQDCRLSWKPHEDPFLYVLLELLLRPLKLAQRVSAALHFRFEHMSRRRGAGQRRVSARIFEGETSGQMRVRHW